jgi:tRNA threonylcarbamoyl adenosine modification protein (Sua5/YciO/YrdC/YwlC family)
MIIRIYSENPNEKHVRQVADALRNGEIVILPTDTVYAFCASVENRKATEMIAKINPKHNDPTTFSLLCSDLSHLSDYCAQIPNHHFRMMKANLPGPFTFILNASALVPKIIHRKKKTVGIRVPSQLITKAIIEELGMPLLCSSLKDDENVLEYTTDPELIHERYENRVFCVVDGGNGDVIPSTVVDLTKSESAIIRQGKGILE